MDIKTEADNVLILIKKFRKITISQLRKLTGIPPEHLDHILNVFEERGLIEMKYGFSYVIFNDATVRVKE
jgi:DNA-binding MarR family transcriptional regulator